jgi:hypothetical protein
MTTDSAANQLRTSIMADIRRFAQESDVSVCEALGVLRMVENDLILMINHRTEDLEPSE